MAKMIQVPYDYTITLPIATAQAVQGNQENPISLEALGLLTNLLSYPSTWELHKTELYKRFAHNKETSVKSAWKSLMLANYIIEFKYRVGRKYEYVYYFRKVPFNNEEKEKILAEALQEYGEISTLDFQDPKMETPKPRDKKKTLSNKKTLKKKEEEEYIPSDLVSFLLQNNIAIEHAKQFETRLLKEAVTGYTHDDILEAINLSLIDFNNGICSEPYIWAVGKLKRLLEAKTRTPKKQPNKKKYEPIRTEQLPVWFDEEDQPKLVEKPIVDKEAQKIEIEEMLKKLGGNK